VKEELTRSVLESSRTKQLGSKGRRRKESTNLSDLLRGLSLDHVGNGLASDVTGSGEEDGESRSANENAKWRRVESEGGRLRAETHSKGLISR